jgi:hypothetical protein
MMPTLLRLGRLTEPSIERSRVIVTLHETIFEEATIRTVFTIELKLDVDANDDERRKAFIDLALKAGEQLYGVSAMLAKKSPTVTVSQSSREGKEFYPLFGASPSAE